MPTDLLFSIIASAVSWLFTLLTWNQYRERQKQHQLLWTLGVGSFALAVTADTVARAQGGWSDGGYRLWYFFGAMHGVTLLGQGTLHLLDKRPWTGRLLEVIAVLMLVSLVIVLNAPLELAKLATPWEPAGAAFPEINAFGFATPRAWTIPFNLYGTLWLVGGALYSSAQLWRINRTRAVGTLLIAVAGLMLAGTSSLNRFGIVYLESVGRMVGVSVLFLGFVFTTVEPEKLPRVNLPKIPPLVLFAAVGWAFAILAFFQLEPAAWRALLEYPGLFLIGAILVGLFWLVLQKARQRARDFERDHNPENP
jgi:hypothetical protein